ncbi:MAG TPA: hypothetical protein VG742_05250 [Dongiaceae bacterium]|nr:hypothetical protein [Dongiaceae bacterium]
MRLNFLAPFAVLLLATAGTAKAEFDPVDCGSTPFTFSGEGYLVDCEQSDEPLRVETSSGGVTVDVMSITSKDRQLFFTIISRRINATHIYMEARSLGENYRAMFDEEGSRDWKGIGRKGGYDTAEFTADISGRESQCITVQRYTNAAYMGYKRHVIGTGCAIGELSAVYEVLSKIGAPGD